MDFPQIQESETLLPVHKVCTSPCLEYCIFGSHILKKDEFILERLLREAERGGALIFRRRLGVLGERGQECSSLSVLSDKGMEVEKELFELEDNAG